jgi:hypothetical protein
MNMSDQYVPQGLDSIGADQRNGCLWKLWLETGVLRILHGVFIRIPYWSLSTSIHCTRSGIPGILPGYHCQASSAYWSGTSLDGCLTYSVQASGSCACFSLRPNKLRSVRSRRDTPHRLVYSWLFNTQNLQGQTTSKGFPDTFSASLILIYGVVL